MRMKQSKKSLSFLFCMVLIVAVALFTSGCNDKKIQSSVVTEDTAISDTEEKNSVNEISNTSDTEEQEVVEESLMPTEIEVLGEGKTQFLFTVVDKEGTQTTYQIHTDKEMVGEALLDLGLIEGENGEFGLYVKTVSGITADYEADGTYWAFYVNGEYAMSGVDSTTIEDGTAYMFKVEK